MDSYFCLKCSTGPYTEYVMRAHNRESHGTWKFECQICLNMETCLRLLDAHKEERHGIVPAAEHLYSCVICLKLGMSASDIDNHYDAKHPKLKHKCPVCLNRFKMDSHTRTHGC